MSGRILHIFLSSIENETRLYKEASYTLRTGICERVAVLGLWSHGLATQETTDYGLEIRRLPTMVRRYRNASFLRRYWILRKVLAFLSIIEYAFACIQAARKIKPDHVSCHNAIMLPVAWAVTRWTRSTLVYLPHELETERTGLTGIAKQTTALIEQIFIRSARNVVVVCDPIRKWYENAYGLTNVHVVRNVPEKDAVKVCVIPEGGFRERFGIAESAKVFIYQGLFSAGRGIEALVDTFSQLAPERFHLVLMGYGEDKYHDMIVKAAAKHTNIHLQPAVKRDCIVSYSAGADVGIFISESGSLSYRYALPNKLFEWAHAGLPILVSDNLEYLTSLVTEGEFGWATPIGELPAAVMRIADAELAPYAENARHYAAGAVWDEDAKIFAHIYGSREKG